MTDQNEIITNPIDVLRHLRPAEQARPPWRGWVAAVRTGRVDPATTGQILATYASLCSAIDAFASAAEFDDVALEAALADDLRSIESGRGRLSAALESPTILGLANVMRRDSPTVSQDEVRDLIKRCGDLVDILNAANDESAPFAISAALSLRYVLDSLTDALQIGVMFVDPMLFAERTRGLITYGLTLQLKGMGREGMLLMTIAIALLGLIPPLAVPAAIAGVSVAIAERANAQELFAKHSARALRNRGQQAEIDK